MKKREIGSRSRANSYIITTNNITIYIEESYEQLVKKMNSKEERIRVKVTIGYSQTDIMSFNKKEILRYGEKN